MSEKRSDPIKPQAKGPIFYSSRSSIVPEMNPHRCQYQDASKSHTGPNLALSLNLRKVPQRGLHVSIPGPKTQSSQESHWTAPGVGSLHTQEPRPCPTLCSGTRTPNPTPMVHLTHNPLPSPLAFSKWAEQWRNRQTPFTCSLKAWPRATHPPRLPQNHSRLQKGP